MKITIDIPVKKDDKHCKCHLQTLENGFPFCQVFQEKLEGHFIDKDGYFHDIIRCQACINAGNREAE